jgi:hypothetical protein
VTAVGIHAGRLTEDTRLDAAIAANLKELGFWGTT